MKCKLVEFAAFAFLAVMTLNSSAQSYLGNPRYGADTATRKNCALNLSLYLDGFKAGDYKTAYKYWKVAYTICPGAQLSALQRGRTIYQSFIENAPTEVAKQAYVDTLLSIYDTRIQYFPSDAAKAMEFKVRDLLLYRPEQPLKVFGMINDLIAKQEQLVNADIIVLGMQVVCELYQKKEAAADQVMDYYSANGAILEKQLAVDSGNEELKKAKESFDAYFVNSGVASCNNLIALYAPKFEKTPSDIALVKKIISLFSANHCTKSDLYYKAAVALQKAEPTPDGALDLARLMVERGEYSKAVPYYKEAANAQSNNIEKACIFLLAADAKLKVGDKQDAKTLARLALDANPNNGVAYIIIANIIGSQKCPGADPVISAGPYFVAVDYLRKAKQVDSSVAADADRLIGNYTAAFPSKTDLFSYAYEEGKTIMVGCGINERTTVRSR
jgi:tetratricopeptide (TPR) repeat protein